MGTFYGETITSHVNDDCPDKASFIKSFNSKVRKSIHHRPSNHAIRKSISSTSQAKGTYQGPLFFLTSEIRRDVTSIALHNQIKTATRIRNPLKDCSLA